MKRNYVLGISALLLFCTVSVTNAQDSERKLGTHNSMTYQKPSGDWKKITMWPFAKCQSLTYEQQYDFGVRLFDLRIRFINNIPYFAHGELEFCGVDANTVIDFLNKKGDCAVILALENNAAIGNTQDEQFQIFCKECLEKYPNVTFTGGWAKYPGNHPTIYKFEGSGVSRDEKYKVFSELNSALDEAKQTGKGDFNKLKKGVKEFMQLPEGFAKQDNSGYWKDWLDNSSKENTILMLDFVQYGAPDSWTKKHPIKK